MISKTLSKVDIVSKAQSQMTKHAPRPAWTMRQKIALACRILFDAGHNSGLAGQVTVRTEREDSYYTERFGLGFDEISASNLVVVDENLDLIEGEGMPNPANRFHSWIYAARPDVSCVIHTHPLAVSALSMLETPLVVAHMDACPLFDDCAFLGHWPGIPVGNEEGKIISETLGKKRALLLAHHGQLVVGRSIEEACVLALTIERAATLQLAALSAGTIKPIAEELGREAHDWMSTENRYALSFSYYARRALRLHPDCLL